MRLAMVRRMPLSRSRSPGAGAAAGPAGGRSAAAGEFMTSIGGYEIYSVEGGMSSWEGERASTGANE